jgi:hypothetical protein
VYPLLEHYLQCEPAEGDDHRNAAAHSGRPFSEISEEKAAGAVSGEKGRYKVTAKRLLHLEAFGRVAACRLADGRHPDLTTARRSLRLPLRGDDFRVMFPVARDGAAVARPASFRPCPFAGLSSVVFDVAPVPRLALCSATLEIAPALRPTLRSRLVGIGPIGTTFALCIFRSREKLLIARLRLRCVRAGGSWHVGVRKKMAAHGVNRGGLVVGGSNW